MTEELFRDGRQERAAGVVGKVSARRYAVNGKLHRLDGPALAHYRLQDGSLSSEVYCIEGKRHRTDGPSHIDYRDDGSIYSISYYRNDELHRIDGPAYIEFDTDGTPRLRTYAIEGEKLGIAYGADDRVVREKLLDFLDAVPRETAEEYVLDSPYAELLDDEEVESGRILKALGQGITTVEGVREVLGGAPAEWVRAYEDSRTSSASA